LLHEDAWRMLAAFMQLTLFTDYTLRTLIYLSSHPSEVVPASRISDAFDISSDHIAKAAKWLTQRGYVRAQRGQAGGLRLACKPSAIRIGQLVCETEPHMNLLECFDRDANRCPITPACKLKKALAEARAAFILALDEYTLEDLITNRSQLVQLLAAGAGR
jgi:Rrf2 family nitric oxide-sensitive transcriptional repressor